jgi:hypothetical protein
MANKTQSGSLFSERTMNGIISIDDGAGTVISGGVITTDDINTANLTANFIQANNLLEADKDETISGDWNITGEWTFSQIPYVLDAPTDPDHVVNKNFVDVTFETKADVSANFLSIVDASNTFLRIVDANANFMDLTTDQAIGGEKVFFDDVAFTTRVDVNDLFMFPTYTPVNDFQVATKIYVDQTTGITEASANDLYVSLFGNQDISGVKTFDDIFMTSGYVPTSPQQVATKAYADSIVAGGGLTVGLIFNGSNTRLQDPNDSPTPFNGFNNTFLGYRSGQHANSFLTGLNTFVGYQSGKHFGQGLVGGTSNNFIGGNSGWDGVDTTPYGFTGTTCIGQFSKATADNQIVLGNSSNNVIVPGNIKAGSLDISGNGNGIFLNNNIRIFFDVVTGSSNHYDASSHFFTGTLFQFIGGLNFEILSANTAWTKSVADNRFLRIGAPGDPPVNQTVLGTKTFASILMSSGYVPTVDLAVVNKGFADSTYETIVDASNTYLSIVDASNTYLPIVDASGFSINSDFFNGSNTRLQDPTDSPSAFNGFNNTFVGYRSGQHANNALTGLNTFVGYQSGKHFAEGLSGGTSNNFIGGNSGWDGVDTTPYGFTGTTCIGQFSKATADNQIVLGNSSNNVIVPGNIKAGSLDISGNGNGIFLNNNIRIFFDVVTGSSNHYDASSHFFTGELFQFIGGLNFPILSTNTAWTKSVADNRFLRIGAPGDPPVNQTVLGTKTFASILMSSGYVPTVDLAVVNKGFADSTYETITNASAIYQLISNIRSSFDVSTSTYYSTAYSNSTFQTIANLVTFFISTSTATRYYSAGYSNATFQTNANIRNSPTNTTSTYFSTNFINNTFQTISNLVNVATNNTSTYFTTSFINNTFQTISNLVNVATDNTTTYFTTAFINANFAPKTLEYASWRYGVTSSGGTAVTTSMPSGSNVFGTVGSFPNIQTVRAMGTGESAGQLNTSTGVWTCQITGMYSVACQVTVQSNTSARIFARYTQATGMFDALAMRSGLTQAQAGSNPRGFICNHDLTIFLTAGDTLFFDFISTCNMFVFSNQTYLYITRLTGY